MRNPASFYLVVLYALYFTGGLCSDFYSNHTAVEHHTNADIASTSCSNKHPQFSDKYFRVHHFIGNKIKFKHFDGGNIVDQVPDHGSLNNHPDLVVLIPSFTTTAKTPVFLRNRAIRI